MGIAARRADQREAQAARRHLIGGLTNSTTFGLTTAQVTSTFVNQTGATGTIPRPNQISLSDAAKALAAIDKALDAGKPLSIPQALLLQQYNQLEKADGSKKVFSITDTSTNLLANLGDLQDLLDDGNLSGVNLTDRATLAVTPGVFLDRIQLFDAIQTPYTLNVTEPFPAADIQYADPDVLNRFTTLEVMGSSEEILDARNILSSLPDSVRRNWLVVDAPENIEANFDKLAALPGLQKIAMVTDPDARIAIPGFQNGARNVGLLRLTQAQYAAGKNVLDAIQPKPPATTANYLVALRDCKADQAAGLRRDSRVVSINFTDTAANVARNAVALNALTTFSQIAIVDTAANLAAQAKTINTLRKPFQIHIAGSGSDRAPTAQAAETNAGSARLTVTGVARTPGANYVARYDADASAWSVSTAQDPDRFVSGTGPLVFDGLTFTFSGAPEDADSFIIAPGENIASVLANAPLLKTLRAGVPVTGSTADVLANAAKLAQMGNVSAITLTDRTDAPLEISYAQYAEGRAALARIEPPAKVKVTDATVANLATLIRDPLVEAVAVTDDVTVLGADKSIAFINKLSDIASPLYLNAKRAAPLRVDSLTARVTSVGAATNSAIASLTALDTPAEGAVRALDQTSIATAASFTPGVYKNVPLLESGSGAGSGATADVIVNGDGEIVSVQIVNQGKAYSGERLTVDPRLLGGTHSVSFADDPALDDPARVGLVGDPAQFEIEATTGAASTPDAPKRPVLTFACENILNPSPPSPTSLPQKLSDAAKETLAAIQLVAKPTEREDGTLYDPHITLAISDTAQRLAIAAATPASATFDFTDLLTVYPGAVAGDTLDANLSVSYRATDGFTAAASVASDLAALDAYSVVGTAAQLAQTIASSAAGDWSAPDWSKISEIILSDAPPQPVFVSKTLLADADHVTALSANVLDKSDDLALAVREPATLEETRAIEALSIKNRIARMTLTTDATELSNDDNFNEIKSWSNIASIQLAATRMQKPNIVIDAQTNPDYDSVVRKIAQSFTITLANATAADALGRAFRDPRVTNVSVRDDWSQLRPDEKPGVLSSLTKLFAAGRLSGLELSGGFDVETDANVTTKYISLRGADIVALNASRNKLQDTFLSQISALDADGAPMTLNLRPTRVKVSDHKIIDAIAPNLPNISFKTYELRDTSANLSAYLSQSTISQGARDRIASITASDSDVARITLAYPRVDSYPDLIGRIQTRFHVTATPENSIKSLLDTYYAKLDRITLSTNTIRSALPADAQQALTLRGFTTRLFNLNGRLVT